MVGSLSVIVYDINHMSRNDKMYASTILYSISVSRCAAGKESNSVCSEKPHGLNMKQGIKQRGCSGEVMTRAIAAAPMTMAPTPIAAGQGSVI